MDHVIVDVRFVDPGMNTLVELVCNCGAAEEFAPKQEKGKSLPLDLAKDRWLIHAGR